MQIIWNNAIMCDSASMQQTYVGWSASYSIPAEKLVDTSLMSSDNMSWLDDSMAENKEALRLLSE